MKRVLTLICLLALAGTAFAGFSLGFKYTEMPMYVDTGGNLMSGDMYMLRFGAMASPQFRIEALLGYSKESFEVDPDTTPTSDLDWTMMALGAGGYYVMQMPANTSFSIGLQVLYGKSSGEAGGYDSPETTALSIDPLMRIDFAIPGAERLAFFTEYGIRYAKATTTVEGTGGADDVDYTWSGYQTYSPMNILAGAYYIF